jgi:hypothetical protein
MFTCFRDTTLVILQKNRSESELISILSLKYVILLFSQKREIIIKKEAGLRVIQRFSPEMISYLSVENRPLFKFQKF